MPMYLMKRLITNYHITLQCSRLYTLISMYPDSTAEQVLGSKSVLWELVNIGHSMRQSLIIMWIWPCVHTTTTQWTHIGTLLATRWRWDETMACLGLYLVIYSLLNKTSYTYIIHGLSCGNVLAHKWRDLQNHKTCQFGESVQTGSWNLLNTKQECLWILPY